MTEVIENQPVNQHALWLKSTAGIRPDVAQVAIPELVVHEKFTLALDQFVKYLADLDGVRLSGGGGSVTAWFRTPIGTEEAPPEAPRVRCSDPGIAETFGTIMDQMNPLHARAVRYHFMISSYSRYTEAWQTVATNEARYFKTPVLEYVKLIQDGVNHMTAKL